MGCACQTHDGYSVSSFAANRDRWIPVDPYPSSSPVGFGGHFDLFLKFSIADAKERDWLHNTVPICHQPADEMGTLIDLACYIHEDCRRQEGPISLRIHPISCMRTVAKILSGSLKTKK